MILFWLICAGLVGIALAFILPTLLERGPQTADQTGLKQANLDVYRDQLSELEADLRNGIVSAEQYQQDRDEIERRLLDDVSVTDETTTKQTSRTDSRAPVYALAVGIPVIAVGLYFLVGKPAALSGVAVTTAQPAAARSAPSGQMSQQQIEANVGALAKRLEQNPNDADGWIMLARSYAALQRFPEASNAYAKAAALKPNDADLLADYAFALAVTNDRQLDGQPYELVKKALRIDPENPKALGLAGKAEFQAKNYKQAIEYWQKVLAKSPTDSELAKAVSENIKQAQALSGTSTK